MDNAAQLLDKVMAEVIAKAVHEYEAGNMTAKQLVNEVHRDCDE